MRNHLSAEDAANILEFLSWQQPLDGVEPQKEVGRQIEAGRSALLSYLSSCIIAGDEGVAKWVG